MTRRSCQRIGNTQWPWWRPQGRALLRPCRPLWPLGPQVRRACLAVSWLGTCLEAVSDATETKPVLVGFYSGLHGEKVGLGRVHLLRHPRAVFDFADRKASARSASASGEFCARLKAKPGRLRPTGLAPWFPRGPLRSPAIDPFP